MPTEALAGRAPIDAPVTSRPAERGAARSARSRGGAGPRLRRPVLAADRAADPRVRRVRRAAPARHRPRADPRARARAALVLSGGPASVYSRRRPGAAHRAARARHPGAGHLLRDAGDGPGPRRPRRGRRGAASSAAPRSRSLDGGGRLLAGLPARAAVLDEPPRRRLRAAAGLRRPGRPARARRSPPARAPSAASTGSSSTPRSSTRPYGTADPRPLPARGRRAASSAGRPPR